MVSVNKTQLNTIPEKWAFDPEVGPWIRGLLEQIDQLRRRTGGDDDTISSVEQISSTNFYASGLIDDPESNYHPIGCGHSDAEHDAHFLQVPEGDTLEPVLLNQSIAFDDECIVVRSTDPLIDEALGLLGGVKLKDKYGYITGLGTSVQLATPSSWVDLWAYGGQRTSPTSTFTPYMASDNAADTSIDIEWTYLDAAGVEQTVTVATDATDGTTPVSLGVTGQESYRGVNVGSAALAGNVSLSTTNLFTGGVPDNQDEVLAFIPDVDGKTQVLAFRAEANKKTIISNISIYLSRANGSAGSAIIAIQTRSSGKTWITERTYQVTTSVPVSDDESIVLDELTDIRCRIRDVSDSGSTISGRMLYKTVVTE
jgi:hypothetical protein